MPLLSKSPSRPTSQSKSSQRSRFLPNLNQLTEAIAKLPDPETWPEDTYAHTMDVHGKARTLQFNRIHVSKSDKRVHRWIYEGKVLIRNHDQ